MEQAVSDQATRCVNRIEFLLEQIPSDQLVAESINPTSVAKIATPSRILLTAILPTTRQHDATRFLKV